jgi:hypothetical protein
MHANRRLWTIAACILRILNFAFEPFCTLWVASGVSVGRVQWLTKMHVCAGPFPRYSFSEEGIEVAWNQIKVNDLASSPAERERLWAEIRVLKQLKHKNVRLPAAIASKILRSA